MKQYTADRLEELMCRELDDIAAKDQLTMGDLEKAEKMTTTVKNLYKIDMMENGDDGYSRTGYSRDGGWRAEGTYARDAYNRGSSYGGRRRDSMGRYSRDDYSGMDMNAHLDAMMRDARDENERRMIENFRKQMV